MSLSLSGVRKAYDGRAILDGIDLAVAAGESVRLVGPSGLGKSTLLEVAAGLTPPDAGRVERRGRVAMTFQDDALLPWADAAGNLAYALAALPDGQARVLPWLARFDLPPALRPAEMSGGMR
ncbi:MAG: ATP-binding cassette domain-containing protein, partial [Rhodospirillaceae bacterium]